jgi:hypothetical protein
MTHSVVGHLIMKDWQLHRLPIALSLLSGGIALAIIQLGGQTPILLGNRLVLHCVDRFRKHAAGDQHCK